MFSPKLYITYKYSKLPFNWSPWACKRCLIANRQKNITWNANGCNIRLVYVRYSKDCTNFRKNRGCADSKLSWHVPTYNDKSKLFKIHAEATMYVSTLCPDSPRLYKWSWTTHWSVSHNTRSTTWYRVDCFGYSVEQSKIAEQGGSKS